MEILDGNHRAQIWEDANMTHAPAWVIDERGKGIESLSEDERAERAEAGEEERQQAAQQKTPAPKAEGKATPQSEQAAKSWEIHDLGKDHNIASDEGYLYHGTNHDRARDIAESGLDTHKPSYGTDQEAWPDGSTDKRSYFTQKADHAWQFSPEEGSLPFCG